MKAAAALFAVSVNLAHSPRHSAHQRRWRRCWASSWPPRPAPFACLRLQGQAALARGETDDLWHCTCACGLEAVSWCPAANIGAYMDTQLSAEHLEASCFKHMNVGSHIPTLGKPWREDRKRFTCWLACQRRGSFLSAQDFHCTGLQARTGADALQKKAQAPCYHYTDLAPYCIAW